MFVEIFDQIGGIKPDLIVVPVGVGSLAQAAVTFAKAHSSHTKPTRILTVEPTSAGCLHASLIAGQPTTISTQQTIMSGLNCESVSPIAWPILQAGVDVSVTVSDVEAHESVVYLRERGVEAGPCGAAGVAALRRIRLDGVRWLTEESVVVMLCTEGARDYALPG